jgi:hypothetical protein
MFLLKTLNQGELEDKASSKNGEIINVYRVLFGKLDATGHF